MQRLAYLSEGSWFSEVLLPMNTPIYMSKELQRRDSGKHAIASRLETVDPMGRSHSALKVQPLDVLPVLLEQAHQLVNGHDHIHANVLSAEVDLSDGNSHAHGLLALKGELNGGLQLFYLGFHVFGIA
mmetsp:Transcript_23754/g.33232  ORF Transcript_23754/g.33232 Transcript_23754/m.33232 type:complete len:128 (-) Transcript_23754:425-808(-)